MTNANAHSASPEPPESSAGSPGCPAWARKRIRELEIALRATETALAGVVRELGEARYEVGRLKGRLAEREGWGVRPGHYVASGDGDGAGDGEVES